ncbi:hypothetical protein B566_EDAN004575 [Ephemera danica]|nr:hypothetical protein B566_EDAN004575 [Ephemera danica]
MFKAGLCSLRVSGVTSHYFFPTDNLRKLSSTDSTVIENRGQKESQAVSEVKPNNSRAAERMARGQQKLQSQAKAAEKAAKQKKQQGHNALDQKKAAQKALVFACAVCKSQMPDPKTYKQHFENKHPKNEMPEELKGI